MSAPNDKQRDCSGNLDEPLLEALKVAFAPGSVELDLNERLIEAALTGPTSTAHQTPNAAIVWDESESLTASTPESSDCEEVAQAELLSLALDGNGSHPLADLAEILRAAYAPALPSTTSHSFIIRETLRLRPQRKVISLRVWSYAAATMAVAAGLAFWIVRTTSPALDSIAKGGEQLVQSRSAGPLFAETFDQKTPTERIDRIYAVRSRELRHNRYAIWRVQ